MKSCNGKTKVGVLALAVEGVLVAMCALPAFAEDDDAAALKTPTNSIEIGATNTSSSSARFGAYSGLNKSGANLVGGFSIRGGNAYGDGAGTQRVRRAWRVT